MSERKDTCATCRFLAVEVYRRLRTTTSPDYDTVETDVTVCKRYPVETEKSHDDWCGEHSPKEPTP